MEHVSFVLHIDPGKYEEYKRRHENVDAELERKFKEVGIKRYHIFFHEGTLFAYMEVEDFALAMGELDKSEANAKWQRFMADMLLDWEDGGKVKMIPEVYRFTS